jgi:hypothetical protein
MRNAQALFEKEMSTHSLRCPGLGLWRTSSEDTVSSYWETRLERLQGDSSVEDKDCRREMHDMCLYRDQVLEDDGNAGHQHCLSGRYVNQVSREKNKG